ncbi:MAG: hypothetical protein ACYCZR_06105 [Burkholderiales bacterium]
MNTQIAEYSPTSSALNELASRLQGVVYDVSKAPGMALARKDRAECVKLRTALEKKRVEIKAPALERARLIDAEAKSIKEAILALESPIDEQIIAEEARAEKLRQEKQHAEQKRIDAIREQIQAIEYTPTQCFGMSADEISKAIGALEIVDIGEAFAEFTMSALLAKKESLEKLAALHAKAVAHEIEQAKMIAERAELDRLHAEEDARRQAAAKVAAAEQAKQDAILNAQREAFKKEMEAERIKQEAIEREARAERAKQQAALDEADRIARAARKAESDKLEAERINLAQERAKQEAAQREAQRLAEEAKHAADLKLRNAAPALLAALLELRGLVASGSEEMSIIDEACAVAGVEPYKTEVVQ